MKTGFCYSDVKCFVPQVLAMALVSLWFSDKKTTILDRETKNRRKALIRDIEMLPERVNMTLTDEYLELYHNSQSRGIGINSNILDTLIIHSI